MKTQLRHQTHSHHISTDWGAIHRCLRKGCFQALGRQPGAVEPWQPEYVTLCETTPSGAYVSLVEKTNRHWRIAMLESDFEELDCQEKELLCVSTPELRLVTPFVHAWGVSIWETNSLDQSLGTWLAFVAAQPDELVVQDF